MWVGIRRINNGSASLQEGFGGFVQAVNGLSGNGLETWSRDNAYHIEWRSMAAVGERAHFSLRASGGSTIEAMAIYSDEREDESTGWTSGSVMVASHESGYTTQWDVMEMVINGHDGRGWFRVLGEDEGVLFACSFDVLFRPPGILYSCSPSVLGRHFGAGYTTPWVLDGSGVRVQEIEGWQVGFSIANPAGQPYPSATVPGNQSQKLLVPDGWACVSSMGGIFGQMSLAGTIYGDWVAGELIEDRGDVEIRVVLWSDAQWNGRVALPWPKPSAWSEYTLPTEP